MANTSLSQSYRRENPVKNASKSCPALFSFLRKTFDMVSNPANSDVVGWTLHGTAFCIKNVDDFIAKVLPRYFRHSNYPSFERQLHLYDFSRLDGEFPTFAHPNFLRGKRRRLKLIQKSEKATLTQADCQDLLSKVQRMQREHLELEMCVKLMEGENQLISASNKELTTELEGLRSQETHLMKILSQFAGKLQEVEGNEKNVGPVEEIKRMISS